MYKDKHLQKQANKRASQRRRDKAKGMTVVPDKGMTIGGYDAPSVTDLNATIQPPDPVGPLDVYSEQRWAYLQGRGYEWFHDRDLAEHPTTGVKAVTIPGDPAYGEVEGGQCRSCGGPVQHPKVVKCLKCCTEGVPSQPRAKATTFSDLPSDVQASIDKHCAENNKGERAGSHSRAAMTERALHYQDVTAV